MRRALPLLAAATAAGCGGPARIPIDGDFTRGAYHLMLSCPDATPHTDDLLYPANPADHTFRITSEGDRLSMTWDGTLLATGWRDGNHVELHFVRHDPWSDADWLFRGEIRDDLLFHERTLAGNVEYGTIEHDGQTCSLYPRSVAWFTTAPRNLDLTSLPHSGRSRVSGEWGRFVWFLTLGPYGMSKKGDPGQRGPNLELFSFASSGAGAVTSSTFDDGFSEPGGGPHPGASSGGSAIYVETDPSWQLVVRESLVWDDGKPAHYSPGIRRVMAGFVTGYYRIDGSFYPAGWTGETGMLPLTSPGLAYWLDVDRGKTAAAAEIATGGPLVVPPSADGRAIEIFDGGLPR